MAQIAICYHGRAWQPAPTRRFCAIEHNSKYSRTDKRNTAQAILIGKTSAVSAGAGALCIHPVEEKKK
jgi:hypothetical protein